MILYQVGVEDLLVAMNFYNNSAEPNRVDKTTYLKSLFSLEGTLRESCDIINPSILIEREEFINANYCYIPNFNRYYFIDKITSVKNKLWRIDLSVDVLMTYKDKIKTLNSYVSRQENEYDPMLNDELYPTQVDNTIEAIEFQTIQTMRDIKLDREGSDNCILINVLGETD